MGFCTEDEVEEFFREAPELERMLVRSGLILVKYWLEVSAEEQLRAADGARRGPDQAVEAEPDRRRGAGPLRRLHAGPAPRCFERTSTPESPWHVVDANDQRRARLNLMAHLLELLPQRRAPDVVKITKPQGRARPAPLPATVAPRPRALVAVTRAASG